MPTIVDQLTYNDVEERRQYWADQAAAYDGQVQSLTQQRDEAQLRADGLSEVLADLQVG